MRTQSEFPSTDTNRHSNAAGTQGESLRRAIDWIIQDKMFAGLHVHGNTTWRFKSLVALAVLTAWSEAPRLTDAFGKASKLSQAMFSGVATQTYQGMMRAFVRWTPELLPLLWYRLHELMEQIGRDHFRLGKWLPLAVDGSRFSTPRTRNNEAVFSAKNFGKGSTAKSRAKWKDKNKRSKELCEPVKPQIWLTLIWHMGLKLPWCWRTGPSTASERHHLMEMLQSHKFPENTLFCCDAGFVGYDLWRSILDADQNFLIRVGGNVKLLENLGHTRRSDGIVCLWPDSAARRRKEPIVLRLIEVQGQRGTMWLVTNVLSRRELSDASLKRLYRLRWGVELQFRTAKQTFGRGKLRSRNAEHALVELDWSLVALAMVQLLAVRERVKLAEPPEQTSVAGALRVIRQAMENWREPVQTKDELASQFQNATTDGYQRKSSKASRHQKKYKDKPTTTKPVITQATDQQRQAYRDLKLAA